jgi:hypothetical protein
MRNLLDWNKGDKYRLTPHHQQVVLALRELANQIGLIERGIGDDPRPFEWGLAQIVDKDSPGEDALKDARYNLKAQVIGGFDPDDSIALADDLSDNRDKDSAGVTFIGTNLAELADTDDGSKSDTHLLPLGMYVIYIGVWDCGKPNQKHYVFSSAPPTSPLQYGYLTILWSPGDVQCTLQPCLSETDVTTKKDSLGADLPTVQPYIRWPINRKPNCLPIDVNEILAYLELEDGTLVLWDPPQVPTFVNKWEVWQNIGTTNPHAVADQLRAGT